MMELFIAQFDLFRLVPFSNSLLITGCRQPELDPNGLSNWTKGAEAVAFGCFPGHQIQSLDEMVVSNCIDEVWVPPPPTCVRTS